MIVIESVLGESFASEHLHNMNTQPESFYSESEQVQASLDSGLVSWAEFPVPSLSGLCKDI